MKATRAALALMALLSATAAAAAGEAPAGRAVVVGGDRDYPPYEFLDANGEPAGFNVDLTRAIAEVMGLRVRIRLGGWSEMRQGLLDGVELVVKAGFRQVQSLQQLAPGGGH